MHKRRGLVDAQDPTVAGADAECAYEHGGFPHLPGISRDLKLGWPRIRTGHILLGLLATSSPSEYSLRKLSAEFSRILVGRIRERLIREFGASRVFQDVDTLLPGIDFAAEIRSQISTAKLMLVFMGPTRLSVADASGSPRIQDVDDFVHREIRWALEDSVELIPLLFDGCAMPCENALPSGLRPPVRFQHLEIRPDPDFHSDVDPLLLVCRRLLIAG